MIKKFTILTSSYNCYKYLPDWYKSICFQTYRPLEVVLVNDHSKDKTKNLIEGFTKGFKEVDIDFKYLKNSKRNFCGTSYSIGLENVTGNYIGILDSDDMLEPFACEYVAGLYEKYSEVTWLYTQHNKYNRKMKRIIKRGTSCAPPPKKSLLYLSNKRVRAFSHWRTFSDRVPHKERIFKRGLRCAVDKYMGYKLEELGIGMFVDKVCYRFRTRSRYEKSISSSEPMTKIHAKLVCMFKKRRLKGNKNFPILEHKK